MLARPTRGGSLVLARLCRQLQRASDEERWRLARTLHDSAAQTLAAASINLALVEGETGPLSPQGRRRFAAAQALVAACSLELRDLSHAMHPPLLAELGLPAALRALSRRQGRGCLRLGCGGLPRFDAAIELACYRVIEEALAGLFHPTGPVEGRVSRGPAGALAVRLSGPRRAGAEAALARMALGNRARAAGGRLVLRASRERFTLLLRFSAASDRRAFPGRSPPGGGVFKGRTMP